MGGMGLCRASHCAYKIRYHMVFCVKYRKWLLRGELESFLVEVLRSIGERYWFVFDAVGCDGNHLHVFVGAAPRYAPSRVVQIIKSITAKQLFKQSPNLRETLWGAEFWSDGGYIGTVGDGVTEDIIKQYVELQGTPEEKEDYNQMKIVTFT